MTVRICPECAAGKHGNCDTTAWDDEADLPVPCPCWAESHGGAGDDEALEVCMPCAAGDHELCDWTAGAAPLCACRAVGHDEDRRDVLNGRLVEDHAGAAVVLSAIAGLDATRQVRAATRSGDARRQR